MLDIRKISTIGIVLSVAGIFGLLGGCANQKRPVRLVSPYPHQMTVVLAPVLNYSGEQNLDTLKVTDILYSELQQVQGFAVIPVNRTLAQMARDGIRNIEDPQQALNLANQLGADMIIIAAITEYNPYYPPIVGIAMQVYGVKGNRLFSSASVNPVRLARSASPLKITSSNVANEYLPKNQIQEIFNSRDKRVAKQVKKFAKLRGTGSSPYKTELYLRSQEYYLRFVCYESIKKLLEKELERINLTYLTDTNSEKEKEFN